jgi:hypothetical protein
MLARLTDILLLLLAVLVLASWRWRSVVGGVEGRVAGSEVGGEVEERRRKKESSPREN